MFVKKKTTKTSLTKSGKYNIKNNCLNEIIKGSVDDDQKQAHYNGLNSNKLPGKTSKRIRIGDVLDVNNVLRDYNDDSAMDDFKKFADSKSKFTRKMLTTTSQNEYDNYDANGNNVVRSDSVTIELSNKQPKSLNTLYNNSRFRVKDADAPKTLDLRLFKFLKTIDSMLDRPGGVNDIFRAMVLPSFLNRSVVFEVENPFQYLVDEEALMVSFLKRLKNNINNRYKY